MIMESNSQPSSNTPRISVEDQAKYLLTRPAEIFKLLKDLSKKPDMITATISGSDSVMMTAVITVLPKKNLLVLDYGPNEAVNKKMLEASRVIFSTRHDRVEVRFSCENIKRVKYEGAAAFAAVLPKSVLWLQRREYFRIKPRISQAVLCALPGEDESSLVFKAADLSITGISLLDEQFQLQTEKGVQYESCKLTLPSNPGIKVKLETRYNVDVYNRENNRINRIGFLFRGLSRIEEDALQRFINMLQLEQHALSRN